MRKITGAKGRVQIFRMMMFTGAFAGPATIFFRPGRIVNNFLISRTPSRAWPGTRLKNEGHKPGDDDDQTAENETAAKVLRVADDLSHILHEHSLPRAGQCDKPTMVPDRRRLRKMHRVLQPRAHGHVARLA